MSKRDKLIARLKNNPNDFTFNEAQSLVETFGFRTSNKGKTSGSKVKFYNGNTTIHLHKPHPNNELKEYQVKNLISELEKGGLI